MNLGRKNLYPPQELLLLGAAVKLGLFEALREGPVLESDLAARLNADPRGIRVTVEALAETGYLGIEGGAVGITGGAREMLFNPGSESYTGYSFMHSYELCRSWLSLPEVIRTGKPARREEKGRDIRSFIEAMAVHAKRSAPEVVRDSLEGLGGNVEVLDAGGGPLTYAREFEALGAKVTVMDLPGVVELMRPSLGDGTGIKMVSGDMTEGLPEGPFGLVYLGNVCHIFGEEVNRKLFSEVYRVLKPGGRIAVQDFVRGVSPRAAMFGVNMLVNTPEGGTWTLDQYRSWLSGAGFTAVDMRDYGERQLITARKDN